MKSLGSITTRAALRKENVGIIPSSFVFTLAASLFFVPGMITDGFSLTNNAWAWALACSAVFLWFAINLIGFSSYKHTEVTLREPLGNTRVLITFLLGVFLLSEAFTLGRAGGVLLVFLGATALTWRGGKAFGKLSDKGVQLTLLTALLYSFVAVVDKKAMAFFPVNFYGFLLFFAPGVMMLPLVMKRKESVSSLKGSKRLILLSSFFVMSSYFFELSAYKLADLGLVFTITRMSTFLSVALGAVLLGEKGELKQRVFGSAAMVSGALLIALS
ncbi:MAG: DMT family transporter [archaeon]